MSETERLTHLYSELDSAHSLVEHLQERVVTLERETLRQRQEFLELRTFTERALGTPSISRQRRLRASGQATPPPTTPGTPEADLAAEEDRFPRTPPEQTPPAPSPGPSPTTPPAARSLVTIVGGKDRKRCEGRVYRVIRPSGNCYSIITTEDLEGPEIKKLNSSLALCSPAE